MFQVQEEIRQLRLTQAEKRLQLKEAATRRKLQEFKQQLLQSNTAEVSTGFTDRRHGVQSDPHSTVIPYSQSVMHPCSHSTSLKTEKVHYTPPATAPVERQVDGKRKKEQSLQFHNKFGTKPVISSLDHHHKQLSHNASEVATTTVKGNALSVDATSNCEQSVTNASAAHPKSLPCVVTMSTGGFQSTVPRDIQSTSPDAPRPKSLLTNNGDKPITSSLQRNPLPHAARPALNRPPDIAAQKSIQHSPDVPQVEKLFTQKQQTSSQLNVKEPSVLPLKPVHVLGTGQKSGIMLSEEAKETVYMCEVHQQRARVLRIRRCIAAAILIQRTWRKHRKSCLYSGVL